MKKIFTLLLAMVAIVAMYAQPQNGLIALDQVNSSAKEKVETIKAERIQKLAALSMSSERHPIAAASAKSATQSNEENVVTLNFTALDDLSYRKDSKDWFMSMSCMDMEKPEFGYIVKFDYFAPADDFCGTFTEADIISDYSYMFTPDGQTVIYSKLDLTVTKTPTGKNTAEMNIAATILGNNGVTYKINCVHSIVVPAEKVETVIKDAVLTMNASEYNFSLAGKNDVMDINLVVRSNRVKGDHSFTVDQYNSQFIHNGKSLSIMSIEAIITAEEVDNALSYVANLKFVSTDTVEYLVTMISPLPTPTQYVDVVCENLSIDETLAPLYGYVYAEAKNDEYEILGMFPGMSAVEGTYTSGVDFYITNNATWNQVEALQYNLVLGRDAAGKWTLTGTARCTDNVVYNLDLKWVAPVADQIVKISYDTPATVFYTPDENHRLDFMNEQGEWFVYIAVNGIAVGEQFGIDKVVLGECFLMNNNTWDMPQISDINGVVEQSNDTTKMIVSVVCFDGVQYDIEMYYAVPAPTKTETYTIQADLNDQIEAMGALQIMGYTADSLVVVSMAMHATQIEGTYGNDGLFGKLGADGGLFNMMDSWTYVGTYNVDRNGYEINYVLKGEVKVSKDAQDNVTALVDVVCDNAVRYQITMVCSAKSAGLDYDAQEGSVDRTYDANDNVAMQTEVDATGAIIYLSIEAADASDVTDIIFFADNIDANTTIPAGTYAINDTQTSGTVLANPGVQNQMVYPSFYATVKEGYLSELFMFVDGTVEVSQNELGKLHVEVNAVNSYGCPIHIVYDDNKEETAIVDVQTSNTRAAKQIKDNQLLILRNGKMYNVMGAELK